ncbi:MAG TPA: hypothetical protein PKI27_00720 [Dermatophilaceae bacterium]|nr:hypothetical protein [Dermatophilaceae bacterium]
MARRPRRPGALPRLNLDLRTFAEGLRFPGIDPRQWISYGLVEGQTQDDTEPEVVFDEQYGPLVKVMLQPSMVPVYCRTAGSVAGNGEGEFHPYVKGDEVLVAIPEGAETADCCIIGRLNNAIDKFPMDSIAGQDPTTNTFGFRRCRTPVVHEYAGPYTIRSALTGALIGIDSKGAVTLLNGDSSGFQIGSDVIGISTKDGSALIQLNFTDKCISLRLDDAVLNLSATGGVGNNTLSVPDALNIITSGNAATEHAATTESVVNLVAHMLMQLGIAIDTANPGPLTGAALASLMALPLADAAYALAVPIAQSTPMTDTLTASMAAIATAFGACLPKVSSFPQTSPGIGCPGLIIG